jgi:hypothetical protein
MDMNNKDELVRFAYSLVDDTIEHVFLKCPENASVRAFVYRNIAIMLQDMAEDLDRD